jgi:hypothetical protein
MSMIVENPNDPEYIPQHGVSVQGRIETQSEGGVPYAPKTWRENKVATTQPADASGLCDCQIGPVPSGQQWYVEWARVKHTSTTLTTLELFKNQIDDLHSVDSIGNAIASNGNNNLESPPTPGIYLGEGEILIFHWTLADMYTVGKVNTQVRISA